jgi:hypothetical protein
MNTNLLLLALTTICMVFQMTKRNLRAWFELHRYPYASIINRAVSIPRALHKGYQKGEYHIIETVAETELAHCVSDHVVQAKWFPARAQVTHIDIHLPPWYDQDHRASLNYRNLRRLHSYNPRWDKDRTASYLRWIDRHKYAKLIVRANPINAGKQILAHEEGDNHISPIERRYKKHVQELWLIARSPLAGRPHNADDRRSYQTSFF